MGCDIHVFVENKIDGVWTPAPPPKSDDDWGLDYYKKYNDPEDAVQWNINRNYRLFSQLAGVRNGHGFAGVDTGEGFAPIDEPRGLPADASAIIRKCSDDWGVDGHSHSHLTLKELQEYGQKAKTMTTKLRGWVGSNEFKNFQKNGRPEGWSGGVGGPNIQHIDNEEMGRRIKFQRLSGHEYTQVEWERSYYETAPYFYDTVLAAMADIGDETRLVFWFDN